MRAASVMLFALGGILAALLPQAARAQRAADWPMYNRDLAGTRYSPLDQINTQNVSQLKVAWTYLMRPGGVGPAAAAFSQVTPIVVHGVMYLTAGDRILALEPETGREIWSYKLKAGLACARGVAYWPGDANTAPRIFFTSLHKLIALDVGTGQPAAGFGKDGEIELTVPFAEVPTIYKNVVILGANVYGPGEVNLHPQDEVAKGIPGDSRAFDARTGKQLWVFHTIPQPSEVGHDTWGGDSWKGRGGTNVWSMTMTVDEKRGIVYMPVGGPAANYWGGDRPGDNLFSNTLVAADAETGKLKWYFQTVHHELWDYDLPPEPALIDIVKDGKKIPAVVQTGKTGYMFILDRVTGKPVFGVEERPVATAEVPSEKFSPTQPFPVKPPPLARVSFTLDDMVTAEDTTPEHAKACRELWDSVGGFYTAGPFTPWLYRAEGAPLKISLSFPGATGGANWGGTASDVRSGYVFVNMQNQGSLGWIVKNPHYTPETADIQLPYDRGVAPGFNGQFGLFSVAVKDASGRPLGNWPCQKPPWETLVAVNVNTGDIAWSVPLGITEELPEAKQHTGRTGAFAGPIATAGGLVFIGATSDNRFRAFDSKTGRELWTAKLAYTATAVPITYQGKNGKQYVAIMAASGSGEGNSQGLVVYALP